MISVSNFQGVVWEILPCSHETNMLHLLVCDLWVYSLIFTELRALLVKSQHIIPLFFLPFFLSLAFFLTISMFIASAAGDILWPFLWFRSSWHHNWAHWSPKAGWHPLSELCQDIPCKQRRICCPYRRLPGDEAWPLRLEPFERKSIGGDLAEIHR